MFKNKFLVGFASICCVLTFTTNAMAMTDSNNSTRKAAASHKQQTSPPQKVSKSGLKTNVSRGTSIIEPANLRGL